MSYALHPPSSARRNGLLGIVIGVHAGFFLLMLAAKTALPQIMEMPLIVEMLQPEAAHAPEPKLRQVVKPQPVRHKPTPAPPQQIKATSSLAPALAAPVGAPPAVTPEPPVPAAEPVSQARFDADYLRNSAPTYPPMSRRLGEEGKVILRVSVTPIGVADSVDVKTSSGSSRLDDAAVDTVKHWKFIPAKRGDAAVQSWVQVPIIFKLEQ